MKRAIFVFVLLGLMGFCAEGMSAEEEPNPLEILAAKVLELDGSEWEIEIKDRDGKKDPTTDVIRFKGNEITLDGLEAEGFPATNYTPSLGRDFKLVVLQSMKKNEKEDILFLRGELRGDTITGVISKQNKKGKKKKTFTFKGSRTGMAQAQQEEPEIAEPTVVEQVAEREPPAPVVQEPVVEPPPPPVVVQKPVLRPPSPKPTPVSSARPAQEEPLPWWQRFFKK